MRYRAVALVCFVLGLVVGCDGGTKPTNALKSGEELKQKEQMKKTAPTD